MKKPIVWNKENVITNGIWIIIGEIPNPGIFPVDKSVKAPRSMKHTRCLVEGEKRHIESWEDITLSEIGKKSVYDETLDGIVFSTQGGVFDMEHIEDCFYVAGIRQGEPVKIGVNASKIMLIVKYKKLLLAIMGMEV